MPVLTVLSCEASDASDQAVCKFAEFLGLQTELVPLGRELADPPATLLAPGRRVLALGGTTLRQFFQRDWFARLLDETCFAFLYGFAPTDGDLAELKWLTQGALASVTSVDAVEKQFTVHSDVRFGSFPVSGNSYTVDSDSASAFCVAEPRSSIESYITVNGHPFFVSAERGRSLLFLLAEAELVDIDTVLSPESSLRGWYAQLVAMTIFLRSAFGQSCWTSPVTGATFIVDDPSLKKRYGFVHYEKLVSELESTGGALTVAFIPYNYNRSDPQTVGLLRHSSDRFSIAVHGCDHTGGEFASLDDGWLAGTSACALDRMRAHTNRTQMPFDNIMVFPQGRFSMKAIRALKACGFTAAVNTTPWPVDYRENPLSIRDLLDVAVTRYESFPIFVRRYPRDIFDYAFDAMFQKPILAVEHHGFFRHGYEPLAKLVQNISALSSNLVWMPLGSAVVSSCVLKQTGDGQSALRHFAPLLRLRNPTLADLSLSLEKPEQDGLVEAVVIGGKQVPFEVHSGLLKYVAHLTAGEELNVTIRYRQTPRPSRRPSWKYRFSASARRVLCDVRDNQLARSERLLSFAEKMKDVFASGKRSGRKSA
jgi:hypothetical protein